MDSGVRAMVDAVGEARRQLRENALPKARDTSREKVPETEEAALLGALAALVESAGELAYAVADRISPDNSEAYVHAYRRLEREARNLRDEERKANGRTK
ncbi:hypothetical protein [Kitasatospora sp. NPDC056531]|uniref:hypothetical protein n=1 Tax=Kitasatospora sp. NPDC056531 TaxID=3345856 RepID=UPI0036A0CDD4